jgi:DNA-binding NarL/FixJ family response regulator
MTKVIIVDDQSSIREFLKINLASEPGVQVVGLADNGQTAIAQVEKHNPDIVLMDIEMPGMDGIEATEIITKRFAATRVVLLTSQDDRQQLNLALKVGARGYILKSTSTQDIANIIRLTEKGFFQIGPILTGWNYSESSSGSSELQYSPNQISPVYKHSEYSDESGGIVEMNHVLSNLTSGLFQLQKTIQSQENTIVNLTNQYTEVQQEIRTRLGDKRLFDNIRNANSKSRKAQKSLTERRQNFLFISSFSLGVITATIIIALIWGVGLMG